ATGNTASDSGDINETLNLPVGSSVTYTVTATIDPSATGTLSNTATVTAPSEVTDTDPSNNDATDTNFLTPVADMSASKTDGLDSAVPGQDVLTYTIAVSNAGPSDVTDATLTDLFPASLTGVSWTSVA